MLEVTVPAREHAPGKPLRLLLTDPIGRQGGSDGENCWIASDQGFPGRVSAARFAGPSGSGSGVSQVLRKTYCERRLRWRLDQSIVGRRCSLGTYPSLYTAISSRSSGTSKSFFIRSQFSGISMGVETNCMPIPSSVVVSQTFSTAAPIPKIE